MCSFWDLWKLHVTVTETIRVWKLKIKSVSSSAGVIHLVCGSFGTDRTERFVSFHTGRTQALHPLCCLHPPPLDVLLHPSPLLLESHHKHCWAAHYDITLPDSHQLLLLRLSVLSIHRPETRMFVLLFVNMITCTLDKTSLKLGHVYLNVVKRRTF